MTSADAQPRRARPSLPVRLLHLAVVSAAVVAAPLLLPAGDHPAFFAAFGAGGRDAWALALLVLVVPPVVAWVPGVVAHLVDRRAGWVVHLLALAAFGALAGLLVAAALDAGTGLAWLVAVVAAAAVPAAYAAAPPLRLGLTLLAPVPLLVLALFVLDTPAGALARGDGNPAGADVTPKRDIPVVMVEFDEFPLYSLQTPSGALDATRFPQFARLARESTWYPRYTPVFEETTRLSSRILT